MDCSPPDFSVYRIFQARILEWVAISFSRGSPDPSMEPTSLMSLALAVRFFTTKATWEAFLKKKLTSKKYFYLFIFIYLYFLATRHVGS